MNKFDLPTEEANKLFYLSRNREGRHIPLLPAFDDNGNLNFWRPIGDKLLNFKSTELIEGEYFSKMKMENGDMLIPFINFLYQKVTTSDTFWMYNALLNDLFNLASSLEKIKLLYLKRNEYDIRRFVITEIEYIFYACRSIYDLVQNIIRSIWKFTDIPKGKQLPRSFADMTLKNEVPLSAKDIKEKYGLTERLALFYSEEAQFFAKLRNFRNQIDHYGKTNEIIFLNPNLGTLSNFSPFKEFNVWNKKTFLPNNIAPIKPIVCHIIKKTIDTMNNFVGSIRDDIKFPNDIAPNYIVFLRSPYSNNINRLEECIEVDVWY